MGNDCNRRGTRFARLLYLVILCMLLSPAGVFAQTKRINLELKNVTVQEAIATLNRTENYSIIVSSDEVDLTKRISVSAKNATIREVLDQVFAGQEVTCTIDGHRISVTKKQPSAASKPAAAPNSVRGRVTDIKGQPIIAATVAVVGTQKGTLTGVDGDFELTDMKFPAKLNVSYLGYISQIVEVKEGGGNSPLEIVLKESDNLMDEVVVVGYGTQRRANLSGAVATISGKDLNARPVVSAANALQGADPSVNITFGTGSPESSYAINIRGSISLNSGSPLVLADGVEVSLSQINPNDIESVSVLKDASSCAIYGAKASAGVVLITTKAGKKGERARITYNGRFGWASNTTSTDFIDTGYDHVRIVNQFMNDSSDGTMNIFRYTEENGGLQKLYDRRNDRTEHPDRPWVEVGDDGKYYYYGNFDWYGYFYNRVRSQQEHNLSLSGGTDKVTYYASGRFYQQYGMFNINKDKYTDYAFRTKVSAQMTPWLKYSNNISFDTSGYKYGGHYDYEGTINALQSNICAAFLPYNPDGSIVQYVNQLGKNSPIGAGRGGQMTADRSKNSKENRYLTLSNQFDITIAKKLVLTAAYDYRQRDRLYKYRNNTFEYSRQEGVMETFTSGSVENSYREVHYGYKGHNVNIYGTYENSWGGHHFKATAGGQYEDYRSTSLDVKQTDLSSDNIDSFTVATGPITLSQSISAYRTLGFFGRVNYDYEGRYIFEASARGDGSSRFEPDHRWGFFPSASAAWRISEESFFEPVRDVMNNLKLRLSVGSLGNQQVSNYAYIEQISTDNQMSYTFDGLEKAYYANVSDPLSSGLTWETVTTYDVGLDVGVLNGRLNFTGDYYIRDTKDMLTTSLTLPDVFGAKTPKANCANLRTKGWEITLSWQDEFQLAGSPFSYNVSASVGDYITKITKYHNPDRLISDHYVGKTLGEIWGYHVEGLFKTDREAAEYQARIDDKAVNNRVYQCKGPAGNYLRAGDVRFADLDGDNVISEGSGTVDDPGDKRIIGNSLPRYNYSFRVGFNWMGFDVSAFFQGIGRRDWYPAAGQASYDFWGPYAFPPTSFIHKDFYSECWSEDNRNAYFPRPRGYNAYAGGSLGETNDRYIQNLAYLRLKNLTVGYTVPQKLTRKIGIDRARVYFSGENLCYWSPLKRHNKTIDPELAGSSSTSKKDSGTGYAYPKTLSVGVDISF